MYERLRQKTTLENVMTRHWNTTTSENVMTRHKRRPTRSSGDGAFMAFMFFGIWLVMIIISYSL